MRDKIMSPEKLKAFAEAVSKSEELQKRFNSIQVEAVKSTAEKLAKLSDSTGTPFTAEEYLKSVAESSEEMSAEQLRSVAGGAYGFEDFCKSLAMEPGCVKQVVTQLLSAVARDSEGPKFTFCA
jgi:predicted ribosomally synthesized peptide with nif11-like leader